MFGCPGRGGHHPPPSRIIRSPRNVSVVVDGFAPRRAKLEGARRLRRSGGTFCADRRDKIKIYCDVHARRPVRTVKCIYYIIRVSQNALGKKVVWISSMAVERLNLIRYVNLRKRYFLREILSRTFQNYCCSPYTRVICLSRTIVCFD